MILMSLYIYYINFYYKWIIVKFRISCRIIIFGLNMVGWEREKLIKEGDIFIKLNIYINFLGF